MMMFISTTSINTERIETAIDSQRHFSGMTQSNNDLLLFDWVIITNNYLFIFYLITKKLIQIYKCFLKNDIKNIYECV